MVHGLKLLGRIREKFATIKTISFKKNYAIILIKISVFFRGFRGQKLCRCEEQGEICGRLVEVSKETHQLGKFFQEILLQQTASHSIIFYCVTSLSLCLLYSHRQLLQGSTDFI